MNRIVAVVLKTIELCCTVDINGILGYKCNLHTDCDIILAVNTVDIWISFS